MTTPLAPLAGHPYTAGDKWFGLSSAESAAARPGVHLTLDSAQKAHAKTHLYTWQTYRLYSYVIRHFEAQLQRFHHEATPDQEEKLFRQMWPTGSAPHQQYTAQEVAHLKAKVKDHCDITRMAHERRVKYTPKAVREFQEQVRATKRPGAPQTTLFLPPHHYAAHPPRPSRLPQPVASSSSPPIQRVAHRSVPLPSTPYEQQPLSTPAIDTKQEVGRSPIDSTPTQSPVAQCTPTQTIAAQSMPIQPASAQQTTIRPLPVLQTPIKPASTQSATVQPTLTDLTPIESTPCPLNPLQQTKLQPAYSQPASSQSEYSQPAYSQPEYSQPAYSQPDYSQPAYSPPAYSRPAPAQHTHLQPTYSQTAPAQQTHLQPAKVQPAQVRQAIVQPASPLPITLSSLAALSPPAAVTKRQIEDAIAPSTLPGRFPSSESLLDSHTPQPALTMPSLRPAPQAGVVPHSRATSAASYSPGIAAVSQFQGAADVPLVIPHHGRYWKRMLMERNLPDAPLIIPEYVPPRVLRQRLQEERNGERDRNQVEARE